MKTKNRSMWRKVQALATEAKHMLQASNRKREAEQWHEPKKFVNQVTNGNVRLKRQEIAKQEAQAVGQLDDS